MGVAEHVRAELVKHRLKLGLAVDRRPRVVHVVLPRVRAAQGPHAHAHLPLIQRVDLAPVPVIRLVAAGVGNVWNVWNVFSSTVTATQDVVCTPPPTSNCVRASSLISVCGECG